jgi:hypothetical protein
VLLCGAHGFKVLCLVLLVCGSVVEQEDVLQPYISLPFAWDEPSLPHRVSARPCISKCVDAFCVCPDVSSGYILVCVKGG